MLKKAWFSAENGQISAGFSAVSQMEFSASYRFLGICRCGEYGRTVHPLWGGEGGILNPDLSAWIGHCSQMAHNLSVPG